MTRAFAISVVALVAVALVVSLGCSETPNVSARESHVDPVAARERWGVAVGTWADEARRRGLAFPPDLREVAALGATDILLPITIEQSGLEGSEVTRSADGATDGELRAMLQQARALGLRVALMPVLEICGAPDDVSAWRGRIAPSDEDAWWRSYEREVLVVAELGASEGADVVVIGSEMSSLSTDSHAARWSVLAARVRDVFTGSLAYVANFDQLTSRAPLHSVDIAGVSAYFPIARDEDASEAQMREAWRHAADRIESFAREVDLPVMLFELGYPSRDGGAMRPWDYARGTPIDLEEQRRAYAAATDVLIDRPRISGAYAWVHFGEGGAYDRWYTWRDKPAERELRRLLGRRAR